ncbi:MAG: restriction endonuclease subunit S [Limisphaerales bacterium]
MIDELPQGWATAPVSEVIEDLQPGFASGEKNVEGGVAHLRMNNIGLDGELVLDLVRTVPEKLAKPRHDLRPGDVLVCTTNSGALVGKCACFDLTGRYAFSNHLTRLRPKHCVVDGRFLRWNLWLHWKRGVFDDKCKHWVNQSTIPKTALLEAEVVLPPLAEQRRIVAKLETLLGKVDACRQRLAKMPVLLKRFRQAVLAAACSGRLTADWREEKTTDDSDDTDKIPSVKSAKSVVQSLVRDDAASAEDLPDSWRNAAVSELIQSSFYGPRFSKESYAPEGVPTIRTTDMGFDGSIVLTDAPRIKLSSEDLEKYCLQHGDLVVTRTGATIGKCALYDKSRGPAIPGAYLIRFRFKQNLVVPKYVLRFFTSPAGQNLLVGGSNAVAQPNVNATTISQFLIPVPPFAEQQEIVRRVEGLFALADQLELRLVKAQRQVDKLTPSLLARAFVGKLVSQGPNDEPASILLERIRATNKSQTRA